MQLKDQIAQVQLSFTENLRVDLHEFVRGIAKNDLSAILLSGSAARGDFYPGKFGGMIDLTVMTRPGSHVKASDIFGDNEEPDIPYHCVQRSGNWYQIAFHGLVDHQKFQSLDEAKKFALLESEVLWEDDFRYSRENEAIRKFALSDQQRMKDGCIGYIRYLLSEYKEDRWFRRQAFVQLHANLDTAIQQSLRCLYYVNGSYAPAEDRRMYYAYSLPRLPRDFESAMKSLHRQDIDSELDYQRRKESFEGKLLKFIEEFGRS